MEIVVPGLVNDTQYQVRQFVKQKDGRVNDLLKGAYACAAPISFPAQQPLSDTAWEDIHIVSQAGKASEYWAVGDTKDMVLSTGETLALEIIGFDHDDLADGSGKAGISFGLKNLMAETRAMNSSNTNSGGFPGSAMYTWLQNTLINSLPSDLQAVLKVVNKKTSAGNKSSTINTNSMKLFLFSEIEIFGKSSYSVPGEGFRYSRFASAEKWIKNLSNGAGSAGNWWGRSPSPNSSTSFCFFDTNGISAASDANNSLGVCFGFCV